MYTYRHTKRHTHLRPGCWRALATRAVTPSYCAHRCHFSEASRVDSLPPSLFPLATAPSYCSFFHLGANVTGRKLSSRRRFGILYVRISCTIGTVRRRRCTAVPWPSYLPDCISPALQQPPVRVFAGSLPKRALRRRQEQIILHFATECQLYPSTARTL